MLANESVLRARAPCLSPADRSRASGTDRKSSMLFFLLRFEAHHLSPGCCHYVSVKLLFEKRLYAASFLSKVSLGSTGLFRRRGRLGKGTAEGFDAKATKGCHTISRLSKALLKMHLGQPPRYIARSACAKFSFMLAWSAQILVRPQPSSFVLHCP